MYKSYYYKSVIRFVSQVGFYKQPWAVTTLLSGEGGNFKEFSAGGQGESDSVCFQVPLDNGGGENGFWGWKGG